MKTKRTLITGLIGAAIATLAVFGFFRETQSVQANATPSVLTYPVTILASETDGNIDADDCDQRPNLAIGCEEVWGKRAIDKEHLLYLPPTITETGKLLVFLCGGNGNAARCENVYPVAAEQGYHVIGLTYPVALGDCHGLTPEENLACFGEVLSETVSGDDQSERTNFSEHGQDSIVNRLVSVLNWARNHQNAGDGWERYLTTDNEVDWSKVHLAGFSNGSSHASFMGTQPEFQSVGRVTLFSGPNDGEGTSVHWTPSNYIQNIGGMTDRRYYGLVHILNKAHSYSDSDNVLFKVTRNWQAFGMEGQFEFDPMVGASPDFGNAHILISTDPPPTPADPIPTPTDTGTTPGEAHPSVVKDRYCSEFGLDEETNDPDVYECREFNGEPIGYEPAWRCILGAGNALVSSPPTADAGPAQTVECQGSGGANVVLDGSRSTDPDCDVLSYEWTGSFGVATGRNPTVFLPVGTHLVTLVVKDEWSSSDPKTVLIAVQDTQPPSLQVTLTPTLLWPPNHKLVRINATITIADGCGGTPPQVVLTSITSNQPDNGGGDGDTAGDIQDAIFGTFDRGFLLRAERAGGDPRGRTYTVTYTATDASGNQTQAAATVRVPHSR